MTYCAYTLVFTSNGWCVVMGCGISGYKHGVITSDDKLRVDEWACDNYLGPYEFMTQAILVAEECVGK